MLSWKSQSHYFFESLQRLKYFSQIKYSMIAYLIRPSFRPKRTLDISVFFYCLFFPGPHHLTFQDFDLFAQDALDELNGRSYDGRDLRIRMDEGRPRRDDGGGRGYGGGRGGGDRYGGRRDERRGSDDRDRRGGGRRRSRSRSRSASRSRSKSRGDRWVLSK